eukprot:CAMPEP_0206481004 /NCGR_PEP_ID=MMETSP0324_2-20121206/37827_1 /ASSEMBLY_ACC=CAM_ASM_000836 /TAXON_ID=2866 /ORGANISM="Crypthecodinium cohnii, Strain Seligo" /LENGTH=129 /DNA_ID=CAMNT_0053958291 /DNA_START=80 /DNA_END=469 /DNA_ORIENTATION=+
MDVSCMGMDRMTSLSVAPRMTSQSFAEMAPGAVARLAGRVINDSNGGNGFAVVDGNNLPIVDGAGLDFGALASWEGTCEVVGTKEANGALRVVGAVRLPGSDFDAELWNEAVKMSLQPQLRHLFAPQQQ